ncbi:hypothetical protein AWV79_24495 [Cupriavidus sp. UYMMa02A]|nr:hypothetical protein AWV79_24495 [Cupriavidus sp. UYMMa02A]
MVPFAAGTSIDTATRVLARGMAKDLGTSVVVENKGGGGGAIGAIAVANAALTAIRSCWARPHN